MAALPNLITVEQFRQMPESGEYVYELHYGEVVALTRPKPRHWIRQRHIMDILRPKVRDFGEVAVEVPFRVFREFDLRAADVALVSRSRWKAIDPDVDLLGAPELVIEVKSPSNTKSQLQELAALCLAHGAIEFWIVDTEKKTVSVMGRDGVVELYVCGSSIPLRAFGGGKLSVDDIFA